jgi:hypothetical protein
MHGIAAVLYPFLGLGVPVATDALARRLDPRIDAAVVASGALAAAVVLGYGAMGVDVLPIEIMLHRTGIVIALGLWRPAHASARRERTGVRSPTTGWSSGRPCGWR